MVGTVLTVLRLDQRGKGDDHHSLGIQVAVDFHTAAQEEHSERTVFD